MLTLILCISCSVPAMAATAKYKQASKAYQTWLRKNTRSGALSYDIIDLDGNGIPELLVSGHESNYTACTSYIFTFDIKKNKMVKLKSCVLGKAHGNQVYYNTKSQMFTLSTANTGGSTLWFYKWNGKKITKVATYDYSNSKFTNSRTPEYKINGKKYSQSTFSSKLNNALRGFKKLRRTAY